MFFSISGVCPLLCSGHGVYAGGQCHCVDGWKGRECEIIETECIDPSCNGHGRCREGVCICSSGWTGESCETSKFALIIRIFLGDLQIVSVCILMQMIPLEF